MTCGLSIATRTGLHLRCMLEDGHDGDCLPRIPDCVPRPRLPMPDVVELQESTFLSHLLNIIQAAFPSPLGGPLFTANEATKLARDLIWQRLGRGAPF